MLGPNRQRSQLGSGRCEGGRRWIERCVGTLDRVPIWHSRRSSYRGVRARLASLSRGSVAGLLRGVSSILSRGGRRNIAVLTQTVCNRSALRSDIGVATTATVTFPTSLTTSSATTS